MKLRIKGNTLRLRLSQNEVSRFAEEGRVEDAIQFGPGQQMAYAVERAANVGAVRAVLDGQTIIVYVPGDLATAWAETDQVGFDVDQPLGDDEQLSILVEKDFKGLEIGRAIEAANASGVSVGGASRSASSRSPSFM